MIRRLLAATLLSTGLLLAIFGNLGIWTRRELLATHAFTDIATATVHTPPVRDALAREITSELVSQEPALTSSQAALQSSVGSVLESDQFTAIFRTAVSNLQHQLVNGDDALTLDLQAIIPLVQQALQSVDPQAATFIPSAGLSNVKVVSKQDSSGLWHGVDIARNASWILPALSALALAGAVALSRKRGRMLIFVGGGLVVIAVTIVVLLRAGRGVLSDHVGSLTDRAAFDAGWDVVTKSLVHQTIVMGVLGGLVAGAGVALIVVRTGTRRTPQHRGRPVPRTAPPTAPPMTRA